MQNNTDWRVILSSALMGAALFAIPMVTTHLMSGIEEEVVIENTVNYELDTFEELAESFYNGSLSATQMQVLLNDFLGYSPIFESEAIEDTSTVEKNENEHDTKPTEQIEELMTAYLDGLYIQQTKLNRIANIYQEELSTLEDITGATLKNDVLKVQGLNSPIVKGLLRELYNTPLYIHSEDDTYSVWVDYSEITEIYSDYMTDFHLNLIELHKDVMRFGYRRADGEIDAKVIYSRLLLLDEIQDGDRGKDNFYWENERYQLAVLFTGFGEDEKPLWDEIRIEQMQEISENTTDENDSYATFARDLMASIEKEDAYGEESSRIANKWMNDSFGEYKVFVEEQSSSDTDAD